MQSDQYLVEDGYMNDKIVHAYEPYPLMNINFIKFNHEGVPHPLYEYGYLLNEGVGHTNQAEEWMYRHMY